MKYYVKFSEYAGKWWCGEIHDTLYSVECRNVIYYDSWRKAMDDCKARIINDWLVESQ